MPNWERFGHTWDQLGRKNALGAILTVDGKVADWNIGEFLATGRIDVGRFMPDFERLSPDTPRTRLLDFGCGVGRVTRVFSQYFDEVVGVDVAPSMIEWAQSLHADCDHCTFILNRAPNLRCSNRTRSAWCTAGSSCSTSGPPSSKGTSRSSSACSSPAACSCSNCPRSCRWTPAGFSKKRRSPATPSSNLPKPLVLAWRKVKYAFLTTSTGPQMEMFGINRPDVESHIHAAGARLLEAKPDNSHGLEGNGYEYWVTK